MLKIAETVSSLGCEIKIVGRERGECCSSDSVPFKTKRFKMLFRRGFLFYGFFNIRLFIYLLFHKSDLLVANDLDTLLPNFLVSKLKNIPIVYDSHEYFTGVPEIQNRLFVKWVWRSIERIIFPQLKFVITVNDSIAELYEKEYNVKLAVIRNCSPLVDDVVGYTRDELGIDKSHLLLILQGTGINIDRGGEELIEAISMTAEVSLLIIGGGNNLEVLKSLVSEMELTGRVKFFPKIIWKELMRYTKSVDVGLSLDKDTNLNYRYSLPNKLFEYISAGIPVIASDLPETGKLINENGIGVIIERVTPENISHALSELKTNPDRLKEFRRNAIATSSRLNWEIECLKVIEFYNKVLICE